LPLTDWMDPAQPRAPAAASGDGRPRVVRRRRARRRDHLGRLLDRTVRFHGSPIATWRSRGIQAPLFRLGVLANAIGRGCIRNV